MPSALIAIQPLEQFESSTLSYLSKEIMTFYNCRVITLEQKNIPQQFFDGAKSPRYSADSLIRYLKSEKNDSVDYVLGVTHKDIFTTKKDRFGKVKEPAEKYKVWGICGLAYMPGQSAITSDFRLACKDGETQLQRFKKVALHEIGHNLGLPHCKNKACLMTDANESVRTIDNESNNLCDKCRKKIVLATDTFF